MPAAWAPRTLLQPSSLDDAGAARPRSARRRVGWAAWLERSQRASAGEPAGVPHPHPRTYRSAPKDLLAAAATRRRDARGVARVGRDAAALVDASAAKDAERAGRMTE